MSNVGYPKLKKETSLITALKQKVKMVEGENLMARKEIEKLRKNVRYTKQSEIEVSYLRIVTIIRHKCRHMRKSADDSD
jgi:hypothetical protein